MIRLPAGLDGVELRELGADDAARYYELVDANRAHLSRYGDYLAERDATREWVERYFASPPDRNIRLGIWRAGELIGRVDLNPVRPPRYAIGYWLDSAFTGRGYATAACAAAIGYARDELDATDIYAGTTRGNAASAPVARRLGFTPAAELPGYTRFHLALADWQPPANARRPGRLS